MGIVMNVNVRIVFLVIFLCSPSQWAQAQEEPQDLNTEFSHAEYMLAPGDIVSVTVFGEPDISNPSVRVPMSGVYSYPLIGDIALMGETTASLAKKVQTKLRAGFLSDPKVSVNIVSYRPIIVTGAVESAGTLPYQEGMTVRIVSALAQVDTSQMDLGQVEIQRNTERFVPSDLDQIILPGDIVSYKSAQSSHLDVYYIYGEVNRSGKYAYEPGLTVEKAIIVAGGYTHFASKRNIVVRRDDEEKTFKAKLNETVQPGDVITIKKRWF